MIGPWLLLPCLLPGTVLVDMVVAAVDGRPITLSELVAETKLVLLRTRDAEVADNAALTPPLLSAVLLSMVHRELLLAEVRRLQLREVPEPDVERAFQPLLKRFRGPSELYAFLERSGFPSEPGRVVPPLVGAILRSELEVERFLEVRVRLGLKLDPAKLLACYEANRGYFKGRPYGEVEPRIRERLRADLEEAAIEQLLAQLKGRSVISYAPGYEPQPQEPESTDFGFRCPVGEPRP